MVDLVQFLRIKRKSNDTFHLNSDIKIFAERHQLDRKYDLLKFVDEQDLLIDVKAIEMAKLSTVFQKICQIYNNNQRYDDCSLSFLNEDI
jgi:hypothetical protein